MNVQAYLLAFPIRKTSPTSIAGIWLAAFILSMPLSSMAADDAEESVSCPDLGIESEYLERHFCDQLDAILRQSGTDRSSWPDGGDPLPDTSEKPWRDLVPLDEAYNRDPRKTLALIKRIKAAGGLKEN